MKTVEQVKSRTETIYDAIGGSTGMWAAARILLNYPADYNQCEPGVKNMCYDVASQLIRNDLVRVNAGQIAQDILLYQLSYLNSFNTK